MIVFPRFGRPDVSIVVVAWRDAPHLVHCLNSIAQSVAATSYEVVLALNEPSPDVLARLKERVTGTTVVTFDANLGFAAAVNQAAKQARGDFLALLNDDCVVEPGWLEHLVELLERRPSCGIVGSTFVDPDGSLQEAGSIVWSDGSTWAIGGEHGGSDIWFERPVDYCSAGSILVRRQVWEYLGGFDERFYPAYYEDVDLALRAEAAGWKFWYQPRSLVRHARSSSTSARYRAFISERSYREFVARWRDTLAERRPPGQVESALWDAMGRPLRALIVAGDLPRASDDGHSSQLRTAVESLVRDGNVHVAFHASRGSHVRQIEDLPTVRVIAHLGPHLAQPDTAYDVTFIDGLDERALCGPTIAGRFPEAVQAKDLSALVRICAELAPRK